MGAKTVVMHVMRTYGAHGGERQLAQYFAAGPSAGIDEHFVFLYRDPACLELFERMGTRVTTHQLLGITVAPKQNPWLELLVLLPLLPVAQLRLWSLLRGTGAKICVVHGIQAAVMAWLVLTLRGKSIKSVYVHRIAKKHGRSHWLKWLYRPYDVVAGVSEAVAATLSELAPKDHLIAVPNGIDCTPFAQAARSAARANVDTRILISVGRLLPHKRQALLVEALQKLPPQYSDVLLWIVGDGPEFQALREKSDAANLSRRIRLFGYRADVAQLLAQATMFVNASAWEGMSNAVLEAMAAGLPSVVVDAPGVTECHIDGETGLVVPPDSTAIAAAVARLLDDRVARQSIAAAAQARVANVYSIEANRQRFLDIYRRLGACA